MSCSFAFKFCPTFRRAGFVTRHAGEKNGNRLLKCEATKPKKLYQLKVCHFIWCERMQQDTVNCRVSNRSRSRVSTIVLDDDPRTVILDDRSSMSDRALLRQRTRNG